MKLLIIDCHVHMIKAIGLSLNAYRPIVKQI